MTTGPTSVVDDAKDWILRAARAVSGYLGKFPVPQVIINIHQIPGDEIHGTTYGGRRIEIRLGKNVTSLALKNDWTMTHEMFHLGFPETDDDYNWMGEGLATYLEPLARARVGDLLKTRSGAIWCAACLKVFLKKMTKVWITPTPGEEHTGWGLVLVSRRSRDSRKTENKKSLDDAIVIILKKGGDGSHHWSPDEILRQVIESPGNFLCSQRCMRDTEKKPMTPILRPSGRNWV